MDINTPLMQKIRASYGAAIADACRLSSVPPAFLAALIANESGGNAGAKRFEKNVLASLWEVLLERSANFGSIKATDLFAYLWPPSYTLDPTNGFRDALHNMDSLATSWGLTQVMG